MADSTITVHLRLRLRWWWPLFSGALWLCGRLRLRAALPWSRRAALSCVRVDIERV